MGKMFRISPLGGFRKKDVIKYLETLSQEKNDLLCRLDAAYAEQNNAGAVPAAAQTAFEPDNIVPQKPQFDFQGEICRLNSKISSLQSELSTQSTEAQRVVASMQKDIDRLIEKNKALNDSNKKFMAENKSRPDVTLAIKCQNDSYALDARHAEEVLSEFHKCIDEIAKEFSLLLDAADKNGGIPQEKAVVKLTTIKEILDRVKYISEK